MKEKKHPVIKLYSYVGTPQLMFFIALFLVLIAPVVSTNKYSLLSSIFDSFFLGSLYYLARSFHPRRLRLIGYFILLALVATWASYFGIKLNNAFDSIVPLILLNISFIYVFKSILQTDEVDLDTVLSAISGYILIGLAFGILFFALEITRPGGFTVEENLSYYKAMYFSFVTLSTLGYGDITPISDSARALVIVTTLFGQFYMAIIVGIIVGKFISSRKNN